MIRRRNGQSEPGAVGGAQPDPLGCPLAAGREPRVLVGAGMEDELGKVAAVEVQP
jgi:hypothetical protein